jgi:hypothetical protein
VKFVAKATNGNEYKLFSLICISDLQTDLDAPLPPLGEKFVNPESHEPYLLMVDKYFSGFVHSL